MQNDNNNYGVIADINGKSIPLGLGVAFSQDLRALSVFSDLPADQQNALLAKADKLPANADYASLLRSLHP